MSCEHCPDDHQQQDCLVYLRSIIERWLDGMDDATLAADSTAVLGRERYEPPKWATPLSQSEASS